MHSATSSSAHPISWFSKTFQDALWEWQKQHWSSQGGRAVWLEKQELACRKINDSFTLTLQKLCWPASSPSIYLVFIFWMYFLTGKESRKGLMSFKTVHVSQHTTAWLGGPEERRQGAIVQRMLEGADKREWLGTVVCSAGRTRGGVGSGWT